MSDKPVYTQLMLHDFSLAAAQLINYGESIKEVPWADELFNFHPYCIFERKDGLLYFYYDTLGIEWKIEQAGNFDKAVMKKQALAGYHKLADILKQQKALEKKNFLKLVNDLKKFWTWWDCMWWMIEYHDKNNLPLDDLIAVRKETEHLAPGIASTVLNSIKNTVPEKADYADVITIEEAIRLEVPSDDVLEKRKHGVVYTDSRVFDSLVAVEKEFGIIIEEAQGDPENITGQVAYKGHAKGRVRRVETMADVKAFKVGEIIVSSTTTPDFIPAMKKAAAILSEHGGAICHAAIASRELKVPCVVGIKGLTKILHTGDEVEVDADKGVVKILKRADE